MTTSTTSASSDSAIDPSRCPVCGGPNGCAMACGKADSGEPCWCTQWTFSEELLNRVPEAARRKACICQRCVAASTQHEQDPA